GDVKKSDDICDASFSISNAKQIDIQTLAESTHNRSTTSTKLQPYQLNLHRKLTEDGEISIFDAEKYYNGGMDEEHSRTTETAGGAQQQSVSVKDDRLNLQGIKLNIKPAIMTSRSVASLNSQSTTIPGLLKDQSPSWRNKVYGRRFISIFSWKCSCSDRKSVNIDGTVGKFKNSTNRKKTKDSEGSCVKQLMEHSDHIERDPTNFNGSIHTNTKASIPFQNFNKNHCSLLKDENFGFTVSKSVVALASESPCEEVLKKGNGQKSFEVLRSPILNKGDNTSGLDSRLTIFAWDVKPRVEDIQAPSDRSTVPDNDSDSSSDLFEIKNLPEKVHPVLRRQAIDGMSTFLTTPCYESSEASIDWIAVTASEVKIPRMLDFEGKTPAELIHCTSATIISPTAKTAKTEEMQRNPPNGYLGCKSQRATKVTGEQHSVPEEKKSNTQRTRHFNNHNGVPNQD
ncbi:hypothetical protein AQUCO_00200578v1, partial [Aquilegia coerulea]